MGAKGVDLTRVGDVPSELVAILNSDKVLAKDMASTASQQLNESNIKKGCTPILIRYCFGIDVLSKRPAGKTGSDIPAVQKVYARFIAEIEPKIKFRYDSNGVVTGGENTVAFCLSSVPDTIFLRPAYFGLQDMSFEREEVKTDPKSQRRRASKLIHEFMHSIGVDASNHPAGARDLEAPQQFTVDGKPIKPQDALHDATTYEHFAKWVGAGLICEAGKIGP